MPPPPFAWRTADNRGKDPREAVLILHGTADKATKPFGSQFFYDTAGSKDKTLKLYDGGFHDLLNDIDRETVIGDIESWIGTRLGLK